MSKITIDRALLEQALEALNVVSSHVCQAAHHKKSDQHAGFGPCPVVERHDQAITALREALAQQPPPPPPECKTEAERTAYAFGWFKALETVQQKKEVK